EESDPDSHQNLVELDRFYTQGNEYAALYTIQRETIVSATRYDFDPNLGRYVEGGVIENPRFREGVSPAVHPNNYSIGLVPEIEEIEALEGNLEQCDIQRVSSSTASMRKKREVENNLKTCSAFARNAQRPIEMPNTLFEKKALKIEVNAFNSTKYCLVPDQNNYLYVDYCGSNSKNKWLYTEFGQLISEINDGKNNQYYCLTAPKQNNQYQYLKMEICDLNEERQKWSFIKNEKGDPSLKPNTSLVSHSGKVVAVYNNYYPYLSGNSPESKDKIKALKILNGSDIQSNISFPIIQFSVDHMNLLEDIIDQEKIDKIKYSIYPTGSGDVSMFMKDDNYLNEYRNYYNAHNNAFFSNYGYDKSKGPQVCYISRLVQLGGSSYNWVKNDYCSTQSKLNSSYLVWYFERWENQNGFKIIDAGKNVLRISKNSYFAYTENTGNYDSYKFWQKFEINPEISTFAAHFFNINSSHDDGSEKYIEVKKLSAFSSLYNYFYRKNNGSVAKISK
ncbi:MAG: RICIN domain-containing protein, partial [Silvanigrellaceae bacterium]|nr:RICIN domain-containing protein [Silvanigrellaceae bacterium]